MLGCCCVADRQSLNHDRLMLQENVHFGLAREAQWASTIIQALTQMNQPDDKNATKSVVPRISIARAKVLACCWVVVAHDMLVLALCGCQHTTRWCWCCAGVSTRHSLLVLPTGFTTSSSSHCCLSTHPSTGPGIL